MNKNKLNYSVITTLDDELKSTFEELQEYLINSDYYNILDDKIKKKHKYLKSRLDRIRNVGEIGDTTIQFKHTPDRYSLNTLLNKFLIDKKLESICPLCTVSQSHKMKYPISLVRSILWRKYLVTPNTFPYFKNHYMILSTDHNNGKEGERGTQSITHTDKYVIKDMMLFYLLIGRKGTMFFNGYIGNSQTHFHFHYTTELVPVQYIIYQMNDLDSEILNTKKNNKIILFKHTNKECLNGIVFYGNYETLSFEIFNFLKTINKKNLLYNILFIPNKKETIENKITVIIYLRKKPQTKKITDLDMGATSVAGFLVSPQMPKFKLNSKVLINNIEKYCNATVVKPTKDLFDSIL